MQKHVNLVDLVKSFPTNIYLQNLASIQKRTSPIKFAHLAEKSENGSISNLSTQAGPGPAGREAAAGGPRPADLVRHGPAGPAGAGAQGPARRAGVSGGVAWAVYFDRRRNVAFHPACLPP